MLHVGLHEFIDFGFTACIGYLKHDKLFTSCVGRDYPNLYAGTALFKWLLQHEKN